MLGEIGEMLDTGGVLIWFNLTRSCLGTIHCPDSSILPFSHAVNMYRLLNFSSSAVLFLFDNPRFSVDLVPSCVYVLSNCWFFYTSQPYCRQNRRVIEENRKTVTIPYIKGASEATRRVLAPLGIRTAMRLANMKWSVMGKIKDREEKTIEYSIYIRRWITR